MSALAGLATSGLGLYNALTGSPLFVQFQSDYGDTLVQFDAMMNETYSISSQPTAFPVEDGSTISDHVIRAPKMLDLTGLVTDTPIGGVAGLINEAATVALSATLPPLGIIAAAAAVATWQAHAGSVSPSKAAYAALVKIAYGDPTNSPPTPPSPIVVVTSLGRFDNMVVTDLSVPRDGSVGGALIFQIKLTQINVVYPQTISVTDVDVPGLAASLQTAGDQQAAAVDDTFTPGRLAGRALVGAPPP